MSQKRSASSAKWLAEHEADRYVQEARRLGYRSRAAFKLIELNEKDKLIKPGIGEATRVLLRRVPRALLLRDAAEPAVQHLAWLAREQQVPVETQATLPLRAVAIIQTHSED